MSARGGDLSANFGVVRTDITPPLTINSRNWGASNHDRPTGVHRPLTATVLAIEPGKRGDPLFLFSLDLGWWRNREDEWFVRGYLLDKLQIQESNLLLALTHTHAGPNLDSTRTEVPGGNEIARYLETLREKCLEIAVAARQSARPAYLTWGLGTCHLAQNRDFADPRGKRFVCGWNPAHESPENRVAVGSVRDATGASLATLVHYACHPTTLGPENTLLSPDYIGPMRDLVESATAAAPCLFLQGASGDLAPMEQYMDDVSIVEKHGEQLGHNVLSVLAGLLPPGVGLEYAGALESGAPLGLWRRAGIGVSHRIKSEIIPVELSLKKDLPRIAEIEQRLAAATEGFEKERLRRQRGVRSMCGDGIASVEKIWLWQLGDALFLAHPFEAYSQAQSDLRDAFPERAILVMNVVNGWRGYLPPKNLYDETMYAVWQTPYERGSLEAVVQACGEKLKTLAS